jgi:transcription antitermination factor NusG
MNAPIKNFYHDGNPEPVFAADHAAGWYLFRVPPQKERVAEQIAKRCGMIACVPMERRKKRRVQKRNRVVSEYPIINGYVFIGDPDWHRIFNLGIIKSVVGFEGVPLRLAPAQMQRLLKHSGQALPGRATPSWRRELTVGDRAEITTGPLRDTAGRIEAIAGKRAEILFELLGVERVVSVPLAILEAV